MFLEMCAHFRRMDTATTEFLQYENRLFLLLPALWRHLET